MSGSLRSTRRRLILALGGMVTGSAAWRAAAAGSPRIAVVAIGSLEQQPIKSLVEGLRERGYVPGRTIDFDPPVPRADYRALADLAAQAVDRNVNVIVSFGTTATQAAKSATKTIPIVMIVGTDPVARGFMSSLARPDANITGLATLTQVLTEKRIEFLKELSPRLRRIAVLWNPESAGQASTFKFVAEAAKRVGATAEGVEIRRSSDLEAASAAFSRNRPDALLPLAGTSFIQLAPGIVQLAAEHKLPVIYEHAEFVRIGGLMSYSTDLGAQLRRAAHYVDRILKGARPGDLPVEQPTTFELVVNLKTAKAHGLAIPQSILLRADRVIE